MSNTPKHHIFPFFELPRELRDWIYGLTFEDGPCSQFSVSHLGEDELQLKYKLRSENIREIIKVLQISSRIRAEALHLLLKTKQKYSPLCRRHVGDTVPGPSIYDIPTFLDVDCTQLVQLCLDQYEYDGHDDYDEYYDYNDMPSARSVYPELMTSVFISSPFFPAVSPWGTDSMAAALPAPQLETPTGNDKFGAIAIRSGSAVHYAPAVAWKGNLLVGGSIQDASCDEPSSTATFVLNGDEAFLYSTDNPPQQLYVDRSGMGQGKPGYITGAQSPPRNGELKGWSVDANSYLVFDGKSPKACPTMLEGNPWSLWWSDLEKPGFNEGCVGIALRAIKDDTPVSCTYSSS